MARKYSSKRGMEAKEGKDHSRYEMDRSGMEYARNAINGGDERSMQRREDKSYGRYNESQKLMSRDSKMIKEDWNAACMLPTGVIEKVWPGAGNYMHQGIGSLFSGVEETMHEDGMAFERENKPKQY